MRFKITSLCAHLLCLYLFFLK